MARTRVTEDQFQVDENEVIQTPTGAHWTAYAEPNLCPDDLLGSLLPSAEDDRPEDVERIALRLLAARPLHI